MRFEIFCNCGLLNKKVYFAKNKISLAYEANQNHFMLLFEVEKMKRRDPRWVQAMASQGFDMIEMITDANEDTHSEMLGIIHIRKKGVELTIGKIEGLVLKLMCSFKISIKLVFLIVVLILQLMNLFPNMLNE